MQDTEWKSIPLIEGIGEVSNDGWFKYYNWNRTGKEKITAGHPNDDGHLRVHLCNDGNESHIFVHRIVAMAFVPIPERYDGIPVDDLVVHHDDGNPANNNADNLRWMTLAEHRALHDAKSIEMCTLNWEHEVYFSSAYECERQTGINHGNISSVCTGRRKSAGGHRFRYCDPSCLGQT